jgi:hypothetical protein
MITSDTWIWEMFWFLAGVTVGAGVCRLFDWQDRKRDESSEREEAR